MIAKFNNFGSLAKNISFRRLIELLCPNTKLHKKYKSNKQKKPLFFGLNGPSFFQLRKK